MKKILIIIGIIIAALIAVVFVKDMIIKTVISSVAGQITGAPVSIDQFSLGILKQSVRIGGFRMGNPKGFPEGILIDLPKINVDYDLAALMKGKLHLRLLEVELKEMGLIKNKEGKLNVDSLKVAQKQEAKPAKEKKPSKPMAIQIDLVNLSMGKVVMKDYTVGKEPSVQVYDINIKKSYKDITSAQQLAALILSEPMKNAGIKGAAIYGAAMLTGVGIIPVAVIATFGGKDTVQQDMDVQLNKLYDVSLSVIKRMGKVSKENQTEGQIQAEVDGANVTIRLKQTSAKASKISVSARKLMLPKPEIARGVIYEIQQELKK